MRAKGIWKQNPEANTWAKRGEIEKWRRLHNEKLHSLDLKQDIHVIILSKHFVFSTPFEEFEN